MFLRIMVIVPMHGTRYWRLWPQNGNSMPSAGVISCRQEMGFVGVETNRSFHISNPGIFSARLHLATGG